MTIVNTLDGYQLKAMKTAIYPEKTALQYLSLGLSSEVGEFNGKLAKWLRKDGEYPKEDIIDELGDVLWFVSELARLHNTDLSVLAQRNLDKLSSRQERGVLKGSGDNR